MRSLTKALGVALVIAGFALASPAITVNYTADGIGPQQLSGPLTAPSDAPWGANGYPGDTVELQTYTGSLDLAPGTSIQKINTLLWTINFTYGGTPEPWPDMNLSIAAARSMTIDGVGPVMLGQTGNLRVNYDNDYISFAGGATISFIVQGYQVDVTPIALAEVGGSNFDGDPGWVQPNEDIMARFDITAAAAAVPDADSTLVLLGTALTGLAALRRKLSA